MNTIRLVKGELFFDEFNNENLDERWTMIPFLPSRFSLTTNPGFLQVTHGSEDVMFLIDEPDTYVLDMKNEYVPQNELVQAGLIVFKELGNSLEVLEYYDETKSELSIYEYLRITKSGNVYTIYGRQTNLDAWELVASLEFLSAGKIGLICKGPLTAGTTPFNVDYVRMYKSNEVQIINVPVGFRVDLCLANNSVVYSRRVLNPLNGAILTLDDIPNVSAHFKIYNELNELIHQSQNFEMCGGDIYYYGSTLRVFVNGEDMKYDEEYFLGYYQSSKIDFNVTLQNIFEVDFNNVLIEAIPYMNDNVGYSLVKFCETIDGTYETALTISQVPALGSKTIYGRITRDINIEPSDVTPFKFNLRLTNS